MASVECRSRNSSSCSGDMRKKRIVRGRYITDSHPRVECRFVHVRDTLAANATLCGGEGVGRGSGRTGRTRQSCRVDRAEARARGSRSALTYCSTFGPSARSRSSKRLELANAQKPRSQLSCLLDPPPAPASVRPSGFSCPDKAHLAFQHFLSRVDGARGTPFINAGQLLTGEIFVLKALAAPGDIARCVQYVTALSGA